MVFCVMMAQIVPTQTGEPFAISFLNHRKHSLKESLHISKYSEEMTLQTPPFLYLQPPLLVHPWKSV